MTSEVSEVSCLRPYQKLFNSPAGLVMFDLAPLAFLFAVQSKAFRFR